MMEKKKKNKLLLYEIIIVFLILLALLLPNIVGVQYVSREASPDAIGNYNELDGKTIVSLVGSIYDDIAHKYFKKSEIAYVTEASDFGVNVTQGKSYTFIYEESAAENYVKNTEGLVVIPGAITEINNCFAGSKTDFAKQVMNEFNEYLGKIKLDGTYDAINKKWSDPDTAPKKVEEFKMQGESRGTIRMCTNLNYMPLAYQAEGNLCGTFFEVADRFCAEYCYDRTYEIVDFTSILAGLQSNKYDIGVYPITDTLERREVINISDPLCSENVYGIVARNNYKYSVTSKNLKDLEKENINIGCVQGSTFAEYIAENYPKAFIKYYSSVGDVITAIKSGQVDFGEGYILSHEDILKEHNDIAYIPYCMAKEEYSFMTSKTEKGNKIISEFNAFLDDVDEDGRRDLLIKKWNSGDESRYELEEVNFSGENGTINIVTCGNWCPMSFYKNNKLTGYFIDLTNMFCKKYGYIPKYSVCDYSGELVGISMGEYDIMADVVTPTPERLLTMNATKTVMTDQVLMITKADDESAQAISKFDYFINNTKKSFYKNFIKEDRWKMLAQGLLVTIGLSIFSCILGTFIGIIFCALSLCKNQFANAFARVYIRTLQGTPIVVLLMVLYYIVFAKWDINGFIVCVIGFSIDFSVYVSEIFKSGIESVPESQYKAGKALGFSNVAAFFNIVVPQALIYIIPVYNGQLVSMVKLTSVAGYISVLDLTKMSDLIRARTYEAFFPLISTAIIYFILSALIIKLLNRLAVATNPDTRNKKLKGVKEYVA